MHVGRETSPATLGTGGECTHHHIRTPRATVDEFTADSAHPSTDQVALDRTTDLTGHDESEAGGLGRVALEPVVHGERSG